MILALLNQKGGVGKTTLATHIAGELALRGQHVVLLDADPQGSSLDWTQRRSQQGLPRLFSAVGLARETLHQEAPELARRADHVIIDGPPRIAALARSALLAAERVLIPVQPSPYDLWASAEMVALIESTVLDMLDRAVQRPHGTNRYTSLEGLNQSIKVDEIKRDRSTQNIRRLREDRPDLHAKVLAKDMTVTEAAVAAGIYPKRIAINLKSPKSAAATIRNNAAHNTSEPTLRTTNSVGGSVRMTAIVEQLRADAGAAVDDEHDLPIISASFEMTGAKSQGLTTCTMQACS